MLYMTTSDARPAPAEAPGMSLRAGAIRIRSKSRSELSADALKPVQERVRALSPETRSHKSP